MGKDSFALMTGLFMATLVIGIVVIINWLSDGSQHQTQTYVAATRDSVTGLKAGKTTYRIRALRQPAIFGREATRTVTIAGGQIREDSGTPAGPIGVERAG